MFMERKRSVLETDDTSIVDITAFAGISMYQTNAMEQKNPFFFLEADSHSASQEMPRLLYNPNIHYRVHKIRHWSLS
jgi:hypothetical protein